jgi:hypothetical protein
MSNTSFYNEIKDSSIFWGCENGSEGNDFLKSIILPWNIGDELSRDCISWVVKSKEWDYDDCRLYFTIVKK